MKICDNMITWTAGRIGQGSLARTEDVAHLTVLILTMYK
ncbi:hypothetical protein P343_08600 [Sporolactobacillus laevolacticus DSM 442]|uniref:Uncharacterized protein n=1 Tax=Sporolactobacillus laevolacticus DSM 442 TaxID=1395513 RepID=V6IY31_9BACL|nr:hypothetical protein P343_08600 [Sporolactobacillus laevolacticus DSM 442]